MSQGEATPQVAWSDEDPFEQMLAIKGHIAFYPDRTGIEILDE